MRIALKAANGAMVAVEVLTDQAPLRARALQVAEWEVLDLLDRAGQPTDNLTLGAEVAFRCVETGKIVCADKQLDPVRIPVCANRDAVSTYETFRVQAGSSPTSRRFFNETHQAHLTAEIGEDQAPLTCHRNDPGLWQDFAILKVAGPSPTPPRPPTLGAVSCNFLTAQGADGKNLASGEYPVLTHAQQDQIDREYTYPDILLETNWAGQPQAFDWLKQPAPFVTAVRRLQLAGKRIVLLVGIEGMGGFSQAGYANVQTYAAQLSIFLRGLPADVTARIAQIWIGLEAMEWTDAAGVALLGRTCKQHCPTIPTFLHLETQQVAPSAPGGPSGHLQTEPIVAWWKAHREFDGLAYQAGKVKGAAGQFHVTPQQMQAQCYHLTDLFAPVVAARPFTVLMSEYANKISQAQSDAIGDIARATGQCLAGTGNGASTSPVTPLGRLVITARDAIDLTTVTFKNLAGQDISAAIRSWPIQVSIKAWETNPGTASAKLHIPLDPPCVWPVFNNVEGNYWKIWQDTPGRWIGRTFDYFRPDGYVKDWSGGWGDGIRRGETVYLLATRLARQELAPNGIGRSQAVKIIAS